jgi:hypothetical protein
MSAISQHQERICIVAGLEAEMAGDVDHRIMFERGLAHALLSELFV